MTKEQKGIIKALSTVFFQEGFDRHEKKYGLGYWSVEDEDLQEHCKACKITGDDGVEFLINTVNRNGQWFIRLFNILYDEYGNFESLNIILYMSVNAERLCWEEMSRCADMIELACFNRGFTFTN